MLLKGICVVIRAQMQRDVRWLYAYKLLIKKRFNRPCRGHFKFNLMNQPGKHESRLGCVVNDGAEQCSNASLDWCQIKGAISASFSRCFFFR